MNVTDNGWKTLAEDILISAYVPEAEQMSREEALKLAIERDQEAATTLYHDAMKVAGKEREEQLLTELGFRE